MQILVWENRSLKGREGGTWKDPRHIPLPTGQRPNLSLGNPPDSPERQGPRKSMEEDIQASIILDGQVGKGEACKLKQNLDEGTYTFEVRQSPCGHVTAQKCYF